MTLSLPRTLRLALVIGTLSGAALAAVAQDNTAPPPPPDQTQGPPPDGQRGGGPRGGGNPERRIEMMQRQLNLTPDQTTQVRAILADGRAKMEALRSDTSTSPRDRRPQMMALMQAESLRVRGLLTPDQQKKYDEMQARMRERRDDRGGPAGSGPPPPPEGGNTPPPPPPQK